MKRFYSSVFLLLLFTISGLFMQSLSAQSLSNKGKEFWVGYGHHQLMEGTNSQDMVIYLSAEQPATVTVSIPGTSFSQTYNVPANSVITTATMPKTGVNDARLYRPGTSSEGVFVNKAIHIVSDVPIVAYAYIYADASSGATMLIPVETWGNSYMTLNSKQSYASDCYSWAYVIASHDNTVIEITPSQTTRSGKPAGQVFQVNLQKGEIYAFMAASEPPNASSKPELSGSKVRSVANDDGDCFPVAVFAGSSRTYNPMNCGPTDGGDNDNQQAFPYHAWGRKYLTAPFSNSDVANSFQTSAIKIAVRDPTTVVKRNGVVLNPSTLIANSYYYFESNGADFIEADKPVMVAQLMGGCHTHQGDPEIVYISPIEQGIKKIGFYRNTKQAITVNYLTLIVPTPGLTSLLIDGSSSFSHTFPHPNMPGYTVVIKRWPAAQAQAFASCDSPFTAITYGMGNVESYGYNAGTNINNLQALGTVLNPNAANPTATQPYTCVNTPTTLAVLVAFQPTQMLWQLNEVPSLSPNANVFVPNPVPSATVMVNGYTYYQYTLPGTYQFSVADTIKIPIKLFSPTIDNCSNSEKIYVTMIVKPKQSADFRMEFSGCINDTLRVFGPDTTLRHALPIYKWRWDLADGITASAKDTFRTFTSPGQKTIQLSAWTNVGCQADTSKVIDVTPGPQNSLAANPVSACGPLTTTFTPTVNYATPSQVTGHYWNFGDGTVLTNAAAGPQTHTFNSPGVYQVKYTNGLTTGSCNGDTARVTVTVYQKPVARFTYPSGCLPANGIVTFGGMDTTADGQPVTAHAWTFGDGSATPANPNTATTQNPSHTYPGFGTYTVTYTVTTANGCTDDTTVTMTLNLAPVFNYPALAPVCQSATGTVNVATATVTNNVPGTGVYSGPGTTSAGVFTPSVAGPGTHTIWYVYTTTGNCKDSVSQTITVNPAPRPSFTVPSATCLPATGTVNFTYTGSVANGQTYSWNFGDAGATAGNPNTAATQNASHNYLTSGNYTVTLTVTSPEGCVKDSTMALNLNVTPVITYANPRSVCVNAPTADVAGAQVTNGITGGTWVYQGTGVTANGTLTPATAGAGTLPLTAIYTSAAGCADTATSSILINPKPTAAFSRSDSLVCAGDNILFTDASTVTAGSVNTWYWSFGDNNFDTVHNNAPVSHAYNANGTFTVSLTAVSDSGCLSDAVTHNVSIKAIPQAAFTMPASVCLPNSAVQFTNTTTVADNSQVTYSWNFGDGQTSTGTNPSHVYAAPGTYNVTLTAFSIGGCSSDTMQVFDKFFEKPVADFDVSDDTICQNTRVKFINLSTAANSNIQQFFWNFGDGAVSSADSPSHVYTTPGFYTISLSAINAQGCRSDTVKKQVNVYLQPKVDAGRSFYVADGTLIQFEPTVNDPSLTFTWSPAEGLNNANALRPYHFANGPRTFVLTVTGQTGCTASDSLFVSVFRPITIPNAISPNGDGVNDTWEITNLTDYPGASVEVYNRYGQMVYRSLTGYTKPWDGKMNGKELPVGTYYYIIDLKNGVKPMNGSITIIK